MLAHGSYMETIKCKHMPCSIALENLQKKRAMMVTITYYNIHMINVVTPV